jgi:hypothetical protein
MPTVICPSCGEKGKIPPNLIGARIKCRICGVSFNVAPDPIRARDPQTQTSAATPASEGIAVEGLDESAWTVSNESVVTLEADVAPDPGPPPAIFRGVESPVISAAEIRQYKILTSKDKVFEGKFDVQRLEDVINDHARRGWTVKSMSAPHLKGYGGVVEEVIVVLLER